jgi:hypothetical protein
MPVLKISTYIMTSITARPVRLVLNKYNNIYKITIVLKVETDIIVSIAASLTGRAVILVIMYVEIFKTGIHKQTIKDTFCLNWNSSFM